MPRTTTPPVSALLKGRHARLATALALALLAAVLWGVHRFVGWDTVAATAATIPASTWVAFACMLGLSYAARVLRLWRLLHDIDPAVRGSRVTLTFFVHNALATLLPARLGEAGMPLLARRWLGMDWAATVGALAWWRVSDLAVVGAIALALLASGARVLAPLYALALATCALPLVVFAVRTPLMRAAAGRSARVAGLVHRVLGGMPGRWTALVADLALALMAWLTKLVAFTLLLDAGLRAVGSAGPLPQPTLVAAAALAADAAGALPLPTVGGVGPFEGGIVLGLGALGVPAAHALGLAITLHGAVLGSIVASGVLALAVALPLTRRHAGAVRTRAT